MGSECKKCMIFTFVIAISFSLVMEGALAARHLMDAPFDFNNFVSIITTPLPGLATSAP